MSDLGDVLELMHGARGRYRTARATIRQWIDHEASQRAFERYEAGQGRTMYAVSRDPCPETETEAVLRVWLEPPHRSREEYEAKRGPSESRLTVVDGDTWWLYTPTMGAMSNDGDASHRTQGTTVEHLFDPAHLLADLDLEIIGRVRHRGRDAIRVQARPRLALPDWRFHLLGFGADEHELLVDAERGVLLHGLASFDGQPFSLLEVLEIAFDEVLSADTFVFVPPPGEIVRSAHGPELRHVTIERAAELAPFPVWILRRVPDGWTMHVTYLPGEERPPIAPTVSIHYAPQTGAHQLTLTETPSGHPAWTPDVDWTVVERDGRELRVNAPDEPGWQPLPQVLLDRDGTQIQLTSDLDVETLLDLAVSLIPAPSEPPAF